MISNRSLQTLPFVTLAFLMGCSGGSSTTPVVNSDTGTGFGQITLSVSDAPVQDALQVCIEFSEAEFHKAGSDNQVLIFDPPAKIDLLAYQGMNSAALFTDITIEAGDYQWIRLAVNAQKGGSNGAGAGSADSECLGEGSYIVTSDGNVNGLYVPSGAQSGLKLNRGFTLPVNGDANFIAEFDLMKSIHAPKGNDPEYSLRPTIKLFDHTETGSIKGEVAMLLATQADCQPAVYVYGQGDVPDDNEDDSDGDSIDPVASAMVHMQNEGLFTFEIGPLLAGIYEVAFSCDSDDPSIDEVLSYEFSPNSPVEVNGNQQSIVDF